MANFRTGDGSRANQPPLIIDFENGEMMAPESSPRPISSPPVPSGRTRDDFSPSVPQRAKGRRPPRSIQIFAR